MCGKNPGVLEMCIFYSDVITNKNVNQCRGYDHKTEFNQNDRSKDTPPHYCGNCEPCVSQEKGESQGILFRVVSATGDDGLQRIQGSSSGLEPSPESFGLKDKAWGGNEKR